MIVKNRVKSLYAPWRKKYILSKKSDECPFCKPDKDLIIFETKRISIQANKFPYSSGHLLVITKRHINDITKMTSKEREELFNALNLATYALKQYMDPEGYNIGCSVGEIAGESIMHLHFHVLPRFSGDVGWNRLGDFNVVCESPKESADNLKKIIVDEKLPLKFGFT